MTVQEIYQLRKDIYQTTPDTKQLLKGLDETLELLNKIQCHNARNMLGALNYDPTVYKKYHYIIRKYKYKDKIRRTAFCKQCAKTFVPRNVNHFFCSKSCATKGRSRKQKLTPSEKKCAYCGKMFTPQSINVTHQSRWVTKKYCSSNCSREGGNLLRALKK